MALSSVFVWSSGFKFASGPLKVTKCAFKGFGAEVSSDMFADVQGVVLGPFRSLRYLNSRVNWCKALSSGFVCDGGPSGSNLHLEPWG